MEYDFLSKKYFQPQKHYFSLLQQEIRIHYFSSDYLLTQKFNCYIIILIARYEEKRKMDSFEIIVWKIMSSKDQEQIRLQRLKQFYEKGSFPDEPVQKPIEQTEIGVQNLEFKTEEPSQKIQEEESFNSHIFSSNDHEQSQFSLSEECSESKYVKKKSRKTYQTKAKPLKTKIIQKNEKQRKERIKSETKNIPKNYGKQIIKFVKQHQNLMEKILMNTPFTYEEINQELQKKKNKISKISDLRNLWTGNLYQYPLRIITEFFLRRCSYAWIFNSRIQNRHPPLKYRNRILEGVRDPENFTHLKSDFE